MRLYELDVKVSVKDAFADVVKRHGMPMNTPMIEMLQMAVKVGNECQFFISQTAPYRPLYRGISSSNFGEPMITKRVRLDDREPTDTTEELHALANEYFVEQYGAPFRNSMFVTGDDSWAGAYGRIYSVYPIGDFEYLWSPKTKDLWQASRTIRHANTKFRLAVGRYESRKEGGFPEQGMGEKESSAAVAEMKTYFEKATAAFEENVLSGYQKDNLDDGIISKHEIMIRTKTYHAISFNELAQEQYGIQEKTNPTTEHLTKLDMMGAMRKIFTQVSRSI
jgi:hypothetical protein